MLNVKSLVTAGVIIMTVSVIFVSFSALNPQPSPYGDNSHGVTGDGYKGLFDILAALNVSSDRTLKVPTADDPTHTLVLLDPQQKLIQREPVFLRQMADWVKQGGRLVVMMSGDVDPFEAVDVTEELSPPINAYEELGLPSIRVRNAGEFENENKTDYQFEDQSPVESFEEAWSAFRRPTPVVDKISLPCWTEGTMKSWSADIKQLALPERDFQYFEFGEQKPVGVLGLVTDDGKQFPVIAEFTTDQGTIVVSTAPFLMQNRVIAERDNAVLAAYLLTRNHSSVLFDEFYHGLAVQGQPLWLLRKYPYGLIVIFIGMLLGIMAWRTRTRLGPIWDPPEKPRRSISEYIATMAALLQRTRDGNVFALRHLRENLYWIVGYDLAIPGTMRTEENVMLHIRRRSPDLADSLHNVFNSLNEMINVRRSVSRLDVLQLLQRFSECRSKLSTIQPSVKSVK